jgi:hypothetical protein
MRAQIPLNVAGWPTAPLETYWHGIRMRHRESFRFRP